MSEDLEDLKNLEDSIFKLGTNPQTLKAIYDLGKLNQYLSDIKRSNAKALHTDINNVHRRHIQDINSAISDLERALKTKRANLEIAINSACERDPAKIKAEYDELKKEKEAYQENLERAVRAAERYRDEAETLKNKLDDDKYKKTIFSRPPPPPPPPPPPQPPPHQPRSSGPTFTTTTPGQGNAGKKLLKLVVGSAAAIFFVAYLANYFSRVNKPIEVKPETQISRTYPDKPSKPTQPPSKPTIPKLNFTYQESLPLEDKVLYDVFVKGNSSNFNGSSLDSSLLQCVKAGLNTGGTFKPVFDINDKGDVAYCDFSAHDVINSKPKILSQKDHDTYLVSGVIKEERIRARDGNFNLVLIVDGKQRTVPIPFSLEKKYEGYVTTASTNRLMQTHYKYENLGKEKKVDSFFPRCYQGDVAIDDEYAYIVHNDLNGPTLGKVSLKKSIEGDLEDSGYRWVKKNIDKNFIPSNFEPGSRRIMMDVDKDNIYLSVRIRPDFEQEYYYLDTMHALLYIAVYDKKNFELIKRFGGQLNRTNPGVRFVTDLKADGKGRFYVLSHWDSGNLMVLDSIGRKIKSLGGRGALPGKFDGPTLVGFDKASNVYVLDSRNERIQKFNLN